MDTLEFSFANEEGELFNGNYSIALPREVKEIPCPALVPIMMVSMIGGLTGLSDFQRTMKLAPDPPALSDSLTTYRVEARGPKTTGAWI